MYKRLFAIFVAIMMVCCISVNVFAASKNYSDWFDLDRINAIDVDEDLTDEASREEVALLIAELCDELELLPSKRTLDFEDDRDFQSSSSYKMITRLSSTGIVCGYPDGTFGPENDITRAEALTMVLRTVDYFSLETDSYRKGNSFTDTEGHWAEVYCDRAYEEGLVSGRGNGRFYPDDEITREEIITILVNLMGESNNPLIAAIDEIYDLEFDTAYYYEEDDEYRYYDDDDDYRYYDDDDDYEEAIKRPVVNTGSSTSSTNSSSSTSSSSKRPERPVVSLDEEDDTTSVNTSNGSRPSRPVVDTTTNNSTSSSVERPTVEVDNDSTVSSRPTRPTV